MLTESLSLGGAARGVSTSSESSITIGGGASLAADDAAAPGPAVRLVDFDVLFRIGTGLVGQVYLVQHVPSGTKYAMKVIPKEFLRATQMVSHVRAEHQILKRVRHPFIVHLAFSFQTASKLILVMEFHPGGDLAGLLRRSVVVPAAQAVFYAAEIGLALLSLHEQGVMHRDLKCANVLLQRSGHVALTDFGFAKQLDGDAASDAQVSHTFCGTEAYMAPEILGHSGHSLAADWWSFGVVVFEMLTGGKPYEGARSPAELLELIRTRGLTWPSFPVLGPEAKDLMTRLLDPNPVTRLKGAAVLKHPFFASIDFAALQSGELEPPWVPDIDESSSDGGQDLSYFPASVTEQTPPSRFDGSPHAAASAHITAATVASDDTVSASLGTLELGDGVFGSFAYASPSVVRRMRGDPRLGESNSIELDQRAALASPDDRSPMRSSPVAIAGSAGAGVSGGDGLFAMSPP